MPALLGQTGGVQLPTEIISDPIRLIDPAPPQGASAMVLACIEHLTHGQTTAPVLDPELLSFAERHRIRSLLAPLGDTSDAGQGVTILALQLTTAAHSVVSLLDAENIDVVVLKGLATARLDYPNGAVRHTGDVDLLVSPADFDRACQLFARAHTPLKAGEPADLLVEQTFRTASGIELDLHHRLFRFGPAGTQELFEKLTPLPDGMGHALDPAGRLVHAAGHLLLAPPEHRRLSSLVDVALIQRRPDLDEDRVERLAALFGISDLVAVARWAATSLGSPEPSPPPTVAASLINRAHLRTNRSIPLETAALLKDQRTVRNRIRYLTYQARRQIDRSR